MKGFRKAMMWTGLGLMVLLLVFSIVSPFKGAEWSQRFFNTIPLSVFWAAFLVVIAGSFFMFRRLLRVPSLLLIHLGCVLVLFGAMWSSEKGHVVQARLFGIEKLTEGWMEISEGGSNDKVTLNDEGDSCELPFSVRIADMWLEYYDRGFLQAGLPKGKPSMFPLEIGREFVIEPEGYKVKILRSFANFRTDVEREEHVSFDSPRPGSNPAIEVEVTSLDGTSRKHIVFEKLASHAHPGDRPALELSYTRMVKDYFADIEVLKDNVPVMRRTVEVNHPLHYGGYYFFLSNFGGGEKPMVLLSVASDTGVPVLFIGYLVLMAGLVWHFWLRPVLSRIEIRGEKDA